MRHGDKINNLSRTASHRKALLSNLSSQLIEHKRIFTTLAKAKSLRVYVEPLLTRAKNDNTHNRRIVFSHLQNKEAIKELFGTIGDKIADRPGGYTRIIKTPRRLGDAADMAMIELVDFNETYRLDIDGTKKKTRRSRRSGGQSQKVASGEVLAVDDASPKAEADTSEEVSTPVSETEPSTTETEAKEPESQEPEAEEKP